ncbi:MAG: prepilin-type N-terminal cleavage/methylation domain-containing protein [Nitriliruptoraceae bacterium]
MRTRPQEGFTLVELLVVLLLVGIVGGYVTTSIVRGLQVSREVSVRATALHDIERSLQVVARELRVADPIYLADDGEHASTIGAEVVRNRTVQVHTFYIEPEIEDGPLLLFQEITEYDLDEVAGGDPLKATPVTLPRRRLITDVDNGIDAVFTYHRADGSEIDCEADGLSGTACVSALGRANQIGIRLVRNVTGQEPIRAETRVNVRNTRYGRVLS